MRLTALILTGILTSSLASAQTSQPSSSSGKSSASQDARQSQTADKSQNDQAKKDDVVVVRLPVSIDRIREALGQPAVEPLKGLNGSPTFRIEIMERQKFQELTATLKFEKAPAVPGGLYVYDQQQRLFPKVDNPLVQPYSAFTQGELVQVLATTFLEKYYGGRALNAISSAERSHAEAAARDEATQAIAEYCAAQPDRGAGIRICADR